MPEPADARGGGPRTTAGAALDTVGPGLDFGLLMPPANQMPHTDAVVVMTTVASQEEAVTLVRTLLDRRLIACGTILPSSRSLYRWDGKIADEQETVVLLKTRSARIETLQVAFGELHPYKVPELLALPVMAGTDKYLAWINGETTLALT